MTLTKPDDVLTLLPCPFCSKPLDLMDDYGRERAEHTIEDEGEKCPGFTLWIYTDDPKQVSAWNRRQSDGSSGMVKAWEDNVQSMLSSGDPDVIRCHEGGGPEDLIGSLVLTMMRTRNSRDKALSAIQPVSGDGWAVTDEFAGEVASRLFPTRWGEGTGMTRMALTAEVKSALTKPIPTIPGATS